MNIISSGRSSKSCAAGGMSGYGAALTVERAKQDSTRTKITAEYKILKDVRGGKLMRRTAFDSALFNNVVQDELPVHERRTLYRGE